jgi:hypothetical protein
MGDVAKQDKSSMFAHHMIGHGVSLDTQTAKTRGHCKVSEWRCVEVMRDDGYSAKDLRRPGLTRIL